MQKFCTPHSAFYIWNAPVPQQLQGEFRKLVFVGASPTRGPIQMRNAEYRMQHSGFCI
jgi:hypothetical protein